MREKKRRKEASVAGALPLLCGWTDVAEGWCGVWEGWGGLGCII